MPDPGAPPAWLLGLMMTALLSAAIGCMILISGVKRMARGETFWHHDPPDRKAAPRSQVRSSALKSRFNRSNGGQRRSALPNAEQPQRSAVQPFTDRSNIQVPATPIAGDIPVSVDEVQRLAHTIALYTKRPNKEIAILEAWGATKGEGDVYTRASRLFDTAMSDAARQAVRAKAPQLAREVEAA